ncbi:MAG: hypothetical protein ACI9PY_001881, partial [Ascidiaceihabitans sp.]
HLQGLVTDAQDEHNLRNQMIKSQQLQKRRFDLHQSAAIFNFSGLVRPDQNDPIPLPLSMH